jgi:hypothetical protein
MRRLFSDDDDDDDKIPGSVFVKGFSWGWSLLGFEDSQRPFRNWWDGESGIALPFMMVLLVGFDVPSLFANAKDEVSMSSTGSNC